MTLCMRRNRHPRILTVIPLTLAVAAAAVIVRAGTFSTGGSVKVSGPSPFTGCTADDPSNQPGSIVPDSEVEPWLAINPTNPANLVAVWAQDWWAPPGQGARGIVAGVSFDGGVSWRDVVVPGITPCSGGTSARTGDSWLSFAPNGDLYLSVLGVNVTSTGIVPPGRILVTKSTNGGLTWGPVTTLIEDKDGIQDKDSITADPGDPNLAYAVWDDTSHSNFLVRFARTTNGGVSWESARTIYNPPTFNLPIGSQIVVLPNGTLLDFFSEGQRQNLAGGGSVRDPWILSVIRSTDKGMTWGPNKPIRIAEIKTSACATSFSCVTDPDTGQHIRDAAILFDVAVDPRNGNLYLQWTDGRFSNFQYFSVAFSMSTDGGSTWSAPIKINKTPTNIPPGSQQAFGHSIHVAADGTIGVAYYDFRFDDPGPGLLTDYWLVHCHPGTDCTQPASWADENRLTDASFDIEKAVPAVFGLFVGDYQGMTADGNDFLAVWSQPQGMDPDTVFFQRVKVSN